MTIQNPPPSLESDARKHFSKAMRDIVAKCLVKDPARRPTAAQLLDHKFFKVLPLFVLCVRTSLLRSVAARHVGCLAPCVRVHSYLVAMLTFSLAPCVCTRSCFATGLIDMQDTLVLARACTVSACPKAGCFEASVCAALRGEYRHTPRNASALQTPYGYPITWG